MFKPESDPTKGRPVNTNSRGERIYEGTPAPAIEAEGVKTPEWEKALHERYKKITPASNAGKKIIYEEAA